MSKMCSNSSLSNLSAAIGFALSSVVVAWPATAVPSQISAARYGYVLGCDGVVDRLDLTVGKVISQTDLAKAKGAAAYFPEPSAPLDGCVANGAAVDAGGRLSAPRSRAFRVLGAVGYNVLQFTLPGLALMAARPGGANFAETSRQKANAPARPHGPDGKEVAAQLLEQSGSRSLYRVFEPDGQASRFAVADGKTGAIAFLDAPSIAGARAHLSPGGAKVLLAPPESGVSSASSSPGLALFDSTTGHQEREIPADLANWHFLAIAPSGKAIFHSSHTYKFFDLGQTFPNTPVLTPGLAI